MRCLACSAQKKMADEPYQWLQTVRSALWVWVWVAALFLLLWTFWATTASTWRFDVRTDTGALDSQRWSVDHVLTGALLLQFMVPLTLAYALNAPVSMGRRNAHVALTIALFVLGLVSFVVWSVDYSNANEGRAENRDNPANDRRWCNVYFPLAGSGCPQTVSTPGLLASQLTVDGPFLWKYWFLVIWLVLLVVDTVLVLFTLRRAANAFELETDDGLADAAATAPPPPQSESTYTAFTDEGEVPVNITTRQLRNQLKRIPLSSQRRLF